MSTDPRRSVSFSVLGDPVPKGRPRFTRSGRAYTPKRTLDAEAAIREIANDYIAEPFTTPVGLDVSFYCATKRRTDADNLAKTVADALNGVAYADDYLVEELSVRVHRRVVGEEPRTEVYIYALARELHVDQGENDAHQQLD